MNAHLSDNEKVIIETLRTLKPYETVTIMADAQGRPDSFLVARSSKILLIATKEPVYTRPKTNLQDS